VKKAVSLFKIQPF